VNKIRTVVFYKNYFEPFFLKLTEKVKKKVVWTFSLIEEVQTVPETYLKHLKGTEGLYEIRVQSGSDILPYLLLF
jgi:hypothetical protein